MRDLKEVEGEKYGLWEAVLGEYVKKNLDLGYFVGIPIEIDVKTVIMTWIVMGLVLLVGFLATKNASVNKPGRLQVVYETVYEFLKDLIFSNIENEKRAASLVTFILTLFMFILFSNMLGLMPTMFSPTADINTTAALALMVIVLVYVMGIKAKGFGHFKHFIQPHPLFLPIAIVEEVAKPVTLAMRLFGNIFAGGMMIVVLLAMISPMATVLGGFIPSVIWLAFKIFIGMLQAFIFCILTIVYISQAVNEHH
ncbi:MAG: F0F1 ATP synthase subunit A [Desulfotomaculum sp.]|nr:F0F1 ATP synthase subunit A [Desulfotomaculum sp.]MCL0081516.1 F0F1 ATP synthase subunit A [Peptococcaceae bacterium]